MSHKLFKLNGLDSKGQSAIEFAFIIPIIFIFFYAVLEFSRLFIQTQRVSTLSREVANTCFQDCSSLTGSQLTSCVGNLVNQIDSKSDSLLQNFTSQGTLIASVYGSNPASKANPPAVVLLGSSRAGGNSTSLYSAGALNAQLVTDQGIVVVGEAFYPYQPITPIKKLLSLLNFPEELYGKTIY